MDNGITRDVRETLYQSLLTKKLSFHDRHQSGDIINRVTKDSQIIGMMFSVGLNNIYMNALSFLIPLLIISFIELQLLFLPILYLIFFIMSLRKYDKKYTQMTTNLRKKESQLITVVSDAVMGAHLIRVNNALNKFLKKFHQHSDDIRKLSFEQGKIIASYPPLFVLRVVIVISFVHAYWLFTHDVITFSQVIQYIGLLALFNAPSQMGIYVFSWYRRGLISTERVLSFMISSVGEESSSMEKNGPIKGFIEFDNVTFGYHPDIPILKNCSFKITAGQKVAIVGMTGSGKSTLFKLMTRIYEPNHGRVLIDGIDVKQWDVESLRTHVIMLEQHPMLFNRSVIDNISFGLDVSREEVMDAAKIAQAHEFITKLDRGYDTIIEENGSNLSGGQRQRIAVARVILRNPRIIILDDFSSAIDSQTESELLDAIIKQFKDRTILLTASRMIHLKVADIIMVLDGGQIIASGTHEELLDSCSQYRQVWERLAEKREFNENKQRM